jgi:hypothetical protein
MKWILHRIGRLTGVLSRQSPSGDDRPAEPQQADSVPNSQASASSSLHTGAILNEKPKELGVENCLKDIPGVTDQMLAAFGEHGVRTIEDLAACATDDLDGWSESKDGKTIRDAGILDCLGLSREDCEAVRTLPAVTRSERDNTSSLRTKSLRPSRSRARGPLRSISSFRETRSMIATSTRLITSPSMVRPDRMIAASNRTSRDFRVVLNSESNATNRPRPIVAVCRSTVAARVKRKCKALAG